MKLYFDSLTTLKVIHAESPIVIFFGTYGIIDQSRVALPFLKGEVFTLLSDIALLVLYTFTEVCRVTCRATSKTIHVHLPFTVVY